MLKDTLLFKQDYIKIVRHCGELSCSGHIANFIRDRVQDHLDDNSDMINILMVTIEELYPKIESDIDSLYPFCDTEISNFSLDCEDYPYPQIQWLYSHLIHTKFESDKLNFKSKVQSGKTFYTLMSNSEMKTLFEYLIAEKLISKCGFENFSKIFGCVDLSKESVSKISWRLAYRRGTHTRALFEMLKHICPWEYLLPDYDADFIRKVCGCFKGCGNNDFNENDLQTNFNKWDQNNYTNIILRNKDYRDHLFKLINFLEENIPKHSSNYL